MKKKLIYRISIFVFFMSLVLIVYSIYEIVDSKNKVKKNIEAWETRQIIKEEAIKDNITQESTVYNSQEKLPEVKKVEPKENKLGSQGFEIIGKLTIVKTKNILPIIEGTSTKDLENGAGHYLHSVLPGEKGNCIIFGHRDSVFKKLEDVEVGDAIIVETSLGEFTYKITDLKITSPEESEIIKHYEEPTLSLVTCYPFNYIGSAPKRFIVTAKLQ